MESLEYGVLAQLVERCVRIAEVRGSNPLSSTTSPQAAYRLRRTFFVKSPPAQPGGVELKRSIEKRRNRRSGERREKGKQKEESEKKATMEMRRIEAMQRSAPLF